MPKKKRRSVRPGEPTQKPEGRSKPHHDASGFDPRQQREYREHERGPFDPHRHDDGTAPHSR
jgi:hypothetical protein